MNAPAGQALPRGVYAITDPELLPETRLAQRVAAAIAGGARIVQYRDKTADAPTRLRRARALAELCRDAGAVFIVNDSPELAVEVGAHGVHLGRDDAALSEARAVLGPDGLIGVSCYDRIDLAVRAAAGGADYVAFGSMFPSTTKPGAVAAPLSLVARASGMLEIPVVAIGGINRGNAAEVIRAGAHAVAVVRDLFAGSDPESAARALCEACERGSAAIE